ncbi:multidrug effflux MFS transporter [Actinomadura fulvescens]|uniref:Multidrug effflux MFS transporter n=1 Tax=Actinomadura fulvescens TaxID=46160 RepID=A0ABN3PK45_9ACTN
MTDGHGRMTQASATTSAPGLPDRRLGLIVILGALTAIAPLSIDMYLPALPRLTADLSTGATQAQLTLTACVIGLAGGQIVAGPLSDRWGRRRPLIAGLLGYSAASLACMVAPSIETFIAFRLLQGATGAAGIVIARAIVRDLYEGVAAARCFSLLMLVNGLAPILAPIMGGQLLRITPWPGVFAALSAIGVALLLAALFGMRETLPPEHRETGGFRATLTTFRGLLGERSFMGYAIGAGLAFAAMFTYISGSSFVLQEGYGMSPQAFSAVFGVNAFGIVLAGQVNRRLVGRIPVGRLLATGLGTVAAGGVALLVAVLAGAGLAVILPALFLVVAAQGLVLPNSAALALSGRPPKVAGSASALLGLAQFAIGGAAAPLAGGTAVPMAVTIAACALAAVPAAWVASKN